MKRVMVVISSLVGLSTIAMPANATSPETVAAFHIEVEDTLTNCGSFTVIDRAVADIVVKLYRDAAGAPYRIQFRVNGTDSVRNSSGGPEYTSPNVFTRTEDIRQERLWQGGIGFAVTVPSYGAVFMDVGSIRIDDEGIHLAGPHQAFEGDFARLCEALA